MMQNEFDDIWKIMKENKFEMANETIKDMICMICRKLLINACSAPCGCVYCLECIEKYLNENEKLCPSNTDECKHEILNLNGNIQLDKSKNQRLSKVIVKCPRKDCNFQDELKKIEIHMGVCKASPINIERKKSSMGSDRIKNNLLFKIFSHSKLFIECIENMRNEMKFLKKDVVELKEENKSLKIEAELGRNDSNMMIFELQTRLDEQIKKFDLLKQKMELEKVGKHRKENIDALELDGETKQSMILELQTRCKQQNLQIEKLNGKLQKMENKFVSIEQERQMKQKHLMTNIDEIEKKQFDATNLSNKLDETLKHVKKRLIKMKINQEIQTVGEFVWKIENFNDKMLDARNGVKTWIDSDSFYSHKHGYKMCLSAYPDGNKTLKRTHLSLFFCLMPGEFDDILEWPFKYDVTLAIINQCNRFIYVSHTIQYDDLLNHPNRNRPTVDRNGGIGFSKFINLDELTSNAALVKNDQIFIKCTVNIPR